MSELIPCKDCKYELYGKCLKYNEQTKNVPLCTSYEYKAILKEPINMINTPNKQFYANCETCVSKDKCSTSSKTISYSVNGKKFCNWYVEDKKSCNTCYQVDDCWPDSSPTATELIMNHNCPNYKYNKIYKLVPEKKGSICNTCIKKSHEGNFNAKIKCPNHNTYNIMTCQAYEKIPGVSICPTCVIVNNCQLINKEVIIDESCCPAYTYKEEPTFSYIKSDCHKCICKDKKRNKCVIKGYALDMAVNPTVDTCQYFVEIETFEQEFEQETVIKEPEFPKTYNRFELMDLDD